MCFEVPVTPLTPDQVSDAIRRVVPGGTLLNIVEIQNIKVPAGAIAFPLAGLEPAAPPTRQIQLWRGHVRYADTRVLSIWARVELHAQYQAVVALNDLPAGLPIAPDSVRVESKVGPLEREPLATRMEDVQGRIVTRAVRAGSFLPLSVLAEAPSVRKGDTIMVEVESGPAHLHFEAVAGSSARTGEMVELRNPLNGKTFRARVDPGPRASIVIGGAQKP